MLKQANMKYCFIYLLSLLATLNSCDVQENDIYEFLNICNDEFYLDHGILASEEMETFQQELIDEGHLIDDSGYALKVLLRSLAKKTYFDPPLKKDDFNNALLYKYPTHLYTCVMDNYNIDSTKLATLSFSKTQQKIATFASSGNAIPVQGLFEIYATELSDAALTTPYIRESVLLFLYRWYFQSKYDRDIPIDLNPNHKNTTPLQSL